MFEHSSREISLEYCRMNIVLAADRAGIVELLRDPVDGAEHIRLGLALGAEGADFAQGLDGEQSPGPGPEVLGGELLARDLPDVFVHVARTDGLPHSIVVQILEQVFPRQVLTAFYDFRQPPVAQ